MSTFFLDKSKEAQDAHPRIAASIRHIARCVDGVIEDIPVSALEGHKTEVLLEQIIAAADNLSFQLLQTMNQTTLGTVILLMEGVSPNKLSPVEVLAAIINDGAAALERHVRHLMVKDRVDNMVAALSEAGTVH